MTSRLSQGGGFAREVSDRDAESDEDEPEDHEEEQEGIHQEDTTPEDEQGNDGQEDDDGEDYQCTTYADYTEDQIAVLECINLTCMEKNKHALFKRKVAVVC